MRMIIIVLLTAACSSGNKPTSGSNDSVTGGSDKVVVRSDDLCTRGVTHVMELMAAESKAHHSTPGPDEQAASDSVAKASIAQCQKEGLSQVQLDCLLAATNWEKFMRVRECAAIQANPPTWLRAGY
jgi:hypothetical protein